MVLAFFIMFFAARKLGDAGFGKYALASTIMYFVLLGNDLGINIYVTREIARNTQKAGDFFKRAIGGKLLFMPIDLLFLVLFLAISPYESDTKTAIIIFAMYGLLQSLVQLNISVFRAYQKMRYETAIVVTEKVVTTALGILVLLETRNLLMFCGVFVVGGVVSMSISWFFLKKRFFQPKIHIRFIDTKKLLIIAIPFGLSMILANIYNNLGTLILSWFEKSEVVGWYASAFRLVNFTNMIPTVLSVALFPVLSVEIGRSLQRFQELYSKGFKYLFYVALPMMVGTILMAQKIIMLVFGEDFTRSIPTLQILIVSGGIIFFNTYFAWFFNATNNQKRLVQILIVALVLNVIFNFVFILELSYIGAAIATVLTEIVIFIICYVYIHKNIVKIAEYSFVYKSILATVIMSAGIYFFHSMKVIFLIGFAGLIYGVALYLLKGFTFQEILILKNREI